MKNIKERDNADGSKTLTYRRQFNGHVHSIPYKRLEGESLEQTFKRIKMLNEYLERLYTLTLSRVSMMDMLVKRKHISITGTPNKNARVVIYRKTHSISWSIRKYGLQRALKIATESLLTMLGIEDKSNRVIIGGILKRRALDDFNSKLYNHKKFGDLRAKEVPELLRDLHTKFKADKLKLGKSNHVYCKGIEVEAYLQIQYTWVRCKTIKHGLEFWESKILKCIVVDSIVSHRPNEGNFKAFMNEVMKYAYRCKFDAVKIVNVVNDDFASQLRRSNIFEEQPTSVENGVAVYSDWGKEFARVITDFQSALSRGISK